MGKYLEFIMLICFCLAEIVILIRVVKKESPDLRIDRITSIATGMGFLTGIIAKLVTNSKDWTFVFYVFGLYLAYAAVIFSLQKNQINN